MHRLLISFFLISLAGGLIPASRIAWADSNAFEGRKLFTTYCLVCHGVKGDGKGPLAAAIKKGPANLAGTETASRSDRELFLTINTGKSHEDILGMPKFSTVLAGSQIDSLIAYIRFVQRSKYPLVGDPDRGRAVYAAYCSLCHGTDGKGEGIMTRVLTIHPADHTSAQKMDALSNEDLARVIADGDLPKFMPSWRNVLNQDEIDSLVGYIRLLSHLR